MAYTIDIWELMSAGTWKELTALPVWRRLRNLPESLPEP